MAGMFDSFKDLSNQKPSNKTPCCDQETNFEPSISPAPQPCVPSTLQPAKPKMPFESYNAKGELDGYWWYQGDTMTLEFNITGEVVIEGDEMYVPAEEFLKDKKILFTLYNFRREEILTKEYEGSTKIVFDIDYKLTRELSKGTYYCSLQVYDINELFAKTIYAQQDCTLTIK